MKSKQVKKILSITIASAVIVGSTPTGPLIVSAEGQEQEENETKAQAEVPKEEQKPAEAQAEDPKPAEQPKEESKPAEQPKEESKSEETTKKEEKSSESKSEESKETPKQEEKQEEQSQKDKKTDKKEDTKKQSEEKSEEEDKTDKDTKDEADAKEITVSWPGTKEVTWDGTAHSVAATAEAGVTLTYTVKKDGAEIASGVAEPKVTEPGNYTIVANSTDKKITISNPATNFTVTKAKIQAFTWTGLTPQYNEGKAVEAPTASFASADKNAPGNINVAVSYKDSGEKNYAAGDKYEVYVSLTDEQKAHYEITGATTATQEIQKKEITVQWSGTDNLVYNGQKQETAKCTSSDYKGEIEVTYSEEPLNAGEYTATATVSDPNYAITNATQKFEIAKYPVTVKADSVEKVYGADSSFTFSVEADNLAFAGDARSLLDKTEGGILTTADGDENVGTHQIVLKDGVELKNYEISYDNSANACLTITQLPVTVSPVADQSKVYGEEDPEYHYTVAIPEETKGGSKTGTDEVQKQLGQEVLTREGIKGTNGVDTPVNEEGYAYKLAKDDYGNFAVSLSTDEKNATFRVNKKSVDVEWSDLDVTYNGKEQIPTGTAKNGKTDLSKSLTYTYLDKDGNTLEGLPKDAGTYKVEAQISDSNYAISEKTKTAEFKIGKCKVSVAAKAATKVYGAKNPYFEYEVEAADKNLTGEAEELLKEQESKEESILTCDKVNVGKHDIQLKEGVSLKNFKIDYKSAKLEITQLHVTVVPEKGQYKYYGYEDEFYYGFSLKIAEKDYDGIDAKTAHAELENAPVLKLEVDNDRSTPAGTYNYILAKEDYGNYHVTLGDNGPQYEVKALPVTVTPDGGQHKTYGENDPTFGYKISYDSSATSFEEDEIKGDLGEKLLTRVEGETPGEYKYDISESFDDDNYALELDNDVFTIDPVQITEVQAINSRQDSFGVKTNINSENRKEDVATKVKVEAKFPGSKEISFSTDIETYIKAAKEGIAFNGSETTIKVQDATYAKARKDSKKSLEWLGKLPAGTQVNVSIVGADGKTVSKETKSFTVAKTGVSLNGWAGTTAGATGNYVVANGGKATPLTLTGSHANEYVEILYSKTKGGAAEASYARMNTSFTPVANNSGSTHVMQYITAGIVDTLNLTCNSVDQTFYVDDQAFPIESSAIQFENRGKEIKIRLPEVGTITNVSIAGAKVEASGTQGQDFTLKVDWSGKNLIPTGTAISVTYKDQAGHEGTGSGTAARSSVSTPITFRIRPELNANGYLNGQSNTLIVSGAACSCEPIRVTAAGMSQTVNATQVDTWTDSNGSWEVMFDMNSLPEKQDFTISAEYMDVNGASHSISAKYEAFVSPADIKSPIYEAMTHISGMVEPGTAVALVINGEQKKYQEIEVDRFGRLSMDDVPMMFGGEDSFDIYVQDIAGNVSIRHYEIPEVKDPAEVTSSVNPLGKYIFQGDKETASSYAATPISGKEFTDKKDSLEIPLIMGMSYEVGKLTVKKSGKGIVISSAVDANGIDKDDYKIENEHLYVYKSKPSADDIKKQTGKEYAYGEEIPLGANDTIWIVDNKDMTILTESIEELELFNYKDSKEYETYQEQ